MGNRRVEASLSTERTTPFTPPAVALAHAKETAMSFAIRNLSVLAYAQGFTLWHYRAGAARLAEMTAQGFFDDASDMFAVGDMLMISAVDGGTMVCVAQTGKAVTVAPMCEMPAAAVAA